MQNQYTDILHSLLGFIDLFSFSPSDFMVLADDDNLAPTLFTKGNFTLISDAMYHKVANVALTIGHKVANGIVIPFIILFIILEVFWEIVSTTIGDDGIQNFTLRQPLILLMLLVVVMNYGPAAKKLDNLTNSVVNYMTEMSAGGKEELKEMQELTGYIVARISAGEKFGIKEHAKDLKQTPQQLQQIIVTARKMRKEEEDSKEENKASKEDVAWYTSLFNGGPRTVIDKIITAVGSGVMYVCRGLIELLAWLGGVILMAVAPLAILAYAIPGGVGKMSLKTVMGTFLQFKLWIVIICVIDMLYVKTYTMYFYDRISNTANPGSAEGMQQFMGTLMAIAFLALYFAVPKFSSLIISIGDAGGMKSAGQNSAKTAKNGIGKMAKWGAAAATGGASLAKNAASATKKMVLKSK